MKKSEFIKNIGIRPDPEQAEAIMHENGPCLVLAGPGSGKTTVLTNHVRFLTQVMQVPESRILVLTFTNLAADEMKGRYCRLAGVSRTGVTFGTFHAVFYRLLCELTEISGSTVISREETVQEVDRLLREEYGKEFTPGNLAETVTDCIGRIKNGLPVNDPVALKIYPVLKDMMRRNGRIDYDDMMLSFYQLLIDDPGVLKHLRERFLYILLDEFQDINRTQYEIIRLLAGENRNVYAVGDDDQSIYGFRGSDPSYMRKFLKDFGRCRKILLSVNHRSTASVVKASRNLIRNNNSRFHKRLRARAGKGLKPCRIEFPSETEEALYICRTVEACRKAAADAGLPAPDFAVLGRTRAALKTVSDLLDDVTAKQVQLLTFHGAKGLEFDCVFIIGANEGITPVRSAADAAQLEEERRCFYVAMTRAKKYLHILYTISLYNKPVKRSRFVSEIDSLW